MSRYMVNKLMWEVDASDEALASFREDPAGFLADWEARWGDGGPPVPAGGWLTGAERAALVTADFGALYAIGANPFLLWQFARSISTPERDIEELIVAFRRAVEPHGQPDFYT